MITWNLPPHRLNALTILCSRMLNIGPSFRGICVFCYFIICLWHIWKRLSETWQYFSIDHTKYHNREVWEYNIIGSVVVPTIYPWHRIIEIWLWDTPNALHNTFMFLSSSSHSFTQPPFHSQIRFTTSSRSSQSAATTRNPYCTFTHSHGLSTSLYPLIRSLHSQRLYRTSPNLKHINIDPTSSILRPFTLDKKSVLDALRTPSWIFL
jgi:hypothetical protein